MSANLSDLVLFRLILAEMELFRQSLLLLLVLQLLLLVLQLLLLVLQL